jgi:hypothetical protein
MAKGTCCTLSSGRKSSGWAADNFRELLYFARAEIVAIRMKSGMRIWIKIGAASLAFVPMVLLILSMVLPDVYLPEKINHGVLMGSAIFNFPACLLLKLAESYHLSRTVEMAVFICSALLWSSLVAWLFWRIAREFLGEDEPEFETNPERAKFDWVGFRVRFVIGFVVGFLFGWRFVRYSTSKTVLLASMTITGLIAGLAYGLYRPNFWSRP